MFSVLRGSLFRILRVTIIVLVLIGSAVWLRGILTSLESEQAVINAEILQLRTPITGQLVIGDIRPGALLKKGDLLFKVQNSHFGDRESVAQYNTLLSQLDSIQNELVGAKNSASQLRVTLEKNRWLFQRGILAKIVADESQTSYDNAVALVQAKTEQLARTQGRVKEMAQQSALQKESVVTMPQDGLIWSVAGKPGEQVDANRLVMEVINPAHIWVDAFFVERHATDLKPGMSAIIRSLDGTGTWRGSLDSVRAGVGRMAFATSVAVPPPEMVKREIAVRVEPAWEQPFGPEAFYGVGRSVQVTFLKGQAQRTMGDVLRERFGRTLSELRAKVASANPAPTTTTSR